MNILNAIGMSAALALTSLTACSHGKTVPLEATKAVPAAMGQVHATRTDNGNTRVDVAVSYLAPPQNVAPGSHVYVVWAQGEDGASPMNIGALHVGKDRKGELETLTPLQKFELFVTPEAERNAKKPSNEPVLRAEVAP